MDIVFYAGSLNYDQGTGNYQELKKITKWDGKQYTLVSRAALRYSLLETGRQLGKWNLADASVFTKGVDLEVENTASTENVANSTESSEASDEPDDNADSSKKNKKNKDTIQPSAEMLLSGGLLNFPEFDLFGYLITNTSPQNFRESSVKISHAISLTPFMYDNHLCGNLGLAQRLVKQSGKMEPNLFNLEEHYTYYLYSVVIDVDSVGSYTVYLAKNKEQELLGKKIMVGNVKLENNKLVLSENVKPRKSKKGQPENQNNTNVKNNVEITLADGISVSHNEKNERVIELTFSLSDKSEIDQRIKSLVESVLQLKRNLKGQSYSLEPKVLVAGVYENNYKTYKDKISLIDEYTEECTEETLPQENGKKITVRVKKTKKPVFEVVGLKTEGKFNNEVLKYLFDEKENDKKEIEIKIESKEPKVFCSEEIKLAEDKK